MSSRRITLGIDEAGRGSLVGDMLVVGVGVAEERVELLKKSGVRDSKTLTKSGRLRLLPEVLSHSDIVVVCRVRPDEIDRENINDLEVRAIERILKHVKSRDRYAFKVLVDEVAGRGKIIESAARKLHPGAEVVVKPGADRDFAEVSAASIVAKCLRDELVRMLRTTYGNLGSGYPSDPRTISWLKSAVRSGSIPDCVRKSWKTLRRVRAETLSRYAKK